MHLLPRILLPKGASTVHPNIDFETYSEAGFEFDLDSMRWKGVTPRVKGIAAVGGPNYAAHASTEVLYLAYNLKQGAGPQRWRPGDPPPAALFSWIAYGGLLEAHNSGFEYLIWHHVCHKKMGWPPLPLAQLRCSMSKARAHSMPGSLENLGAALGVLEQKDLVGHRVMLKLSQPKNPTKTNPAVRWTPSNASGDFATLYAYGDQDISAESAVSAQLPDLSPAELDLWLLDQKINMRGVCIDTTSLEHCITAVDKAVAKYTQELLKLTRNAVASAGEVAKILGWLAGRGSALPNLQEETVQAALQDPYVLPEDVRRVLEIRASIGSASVKKLYAMARTVSKDGRLRGLFSYCGADRTGRWAGRGAQPQNITNSGPKIKQCDTVSGCGRYYGSAGEWCPFCGTTEMFATPGEWCPEAIDDFLAIIATGDLPTIERFLGDAVAGVSGCIRGLFVAPEGKDLICSDYSAIEGVVAAMISGEQWRIDVFKGHGKIYEMGASKITGVPFEEMMSYRERTGQHHPTRKKIGKVSELASGFGGWINAWLRFGAGAFMGEQEIKESILAWRAASPSIVEMWGGQSRKNPHKWEFTPSLFGLEGAFVNAVRYPGQTFRHREISYQLLDGVMYGTLPSGRNLTYHNPSLRAHTARNGEQEYEIRHWGVDSLTKRWAQLTTYGGKLFENVVQAVARDLLAYAMPRLEAAGYSIVLHVHDEIVAEVPAGTGSVEEFEKIMASVPPWAEGWPVRASGGWRGKRYRKD